MHRFYCNHAIFGRIVVHCCLIMFVLQLQFNWSGTVRVPALCQYAHKLAFLASQSLQASPQGEATRKIERTLYFL